MRRSRRLLAAVAFGVLLATACTDSGPTGDRASPAPQPTVTDGPTITVGAFNFPESETLAHVYALGLEAAGYPTSVRVAVGPREVAQPALLEGAIDMLVEYTGNALRFARSGQDIDLRDPAAVHAALLAEYADDDLVAAAFAPAQDVDGLAVTRAFAQEHGLTRISDLKPIEDAIVFGAGPECPERLSCLRGYREHYGLTFGAFKELDVAGPETVAALATGDINAANLFTTQGVVVANDFVFLEDDLQLQLPQNIVPVITRAVADAYGPELLTRIDAISARITTDELTAMNARVEVELEPSEDVARAWLERNGLL